jgi:hypothetical protein
MTNSGSGKRSKRDDVECSRFFGKQDDEKKDDCAVNSANSVCPPPGCASDEKPKGEGRKERGDDEAHGPEIKLWICALD